MSSSTTDPTVAALQEDVAALKRDIGSLLAHLKEGASVGAQTAADQIGDNASRIYRTAASEGCKAAKAVGQQIEEQPLLALLIVLGIGYIGGRLLTR
jgi:hypothetical protein